MGRLGSSRHYGSRISGRYTFSDTKKSEQMSKTFYIETFGCQMNAHDSEKVVGTLQQRGLHPGGGRGRCRPDPLQHLLHPRQGRAEGLSPAERVQAHAGRGQALRRARLRRPAGRRRRSSSAPPTSRSSPVRASYRNLPEMLAPARGRRDPRHRARRPPDRRDLRHRVHRTLQPAPRLHHHHRRLR